MREHEAEAAVVAEAGRSDRGVGRVTVASSMAGRGTDIKLSPAAAAAGGLYVVAAQMHDRARIDRQLYGRCARQGDPGTVRQFVSFEDELLQQAFGTAYVARLVAAKGAGELGSSKNGRRAPGELFPATRWMRLFRLAQSRLESRHARQRRRLLDAERDLGHDPALHAPGEFLKPTNLLWTTYISTKRVDAPARNFVTRCAASRKGENRRRRRPNHSDLRRDDLAG